MQLVWTITAELEQPLEQEQVSALVDVAWQLERAVTNALKWDAHADEFAVECQGAEVKV